MLAERALLDALGGSCSSPVAALTTRVDDGWALRAAIFSPDGALRREGMARFADDDLAPVRELAAQLLQDAPAAIAAHFEGPA